MVIGLAAIFSPYAGGIVVLLIEGLAAADAPTARTVAGMYIFGAVFAFAVGCLVSCMARTPLGLRDYAAALILVGATVGYDILRTPDPSEALSRLALATGGALLGAFLGDLTRAAA